MNNTYEFLYSFNFTFEWMSEYINDPYIYNQGVFEIYISRRNLINREHIPNNWIFI